MELDNIADDIQAKPGTLRSDLKILPAHVVPVEDVVDLLFIDARSLIGDVDGDELFTLFVVDRNLSFFR
jgi:hypothetical protein